ncbi:MAG: response regulator [Acidobacteriota bacterium]
MQILDLLGLTATGAGSGEEALATPPEPAFDLLLTDFLRPGSNGWETSRRLVERWPALKVIVMSGYAEDEAVRRGIGEGRLNYLQKPFDLAALSNAIERVLAE